MGDGYSVAWRVYDAQYWGVPQRRKRIYLVADFGSERAGEILFERESVRGNPAQSREAREGTAADAEGSARGSCYAFHLQQDPIGGRISPCIGGRHQATVGVFIGGQGAKAGGIGYSEKIAPCLKSTPIVLCAGNGQLNQISMQPQSNTLDCMHDQQMVLIEQERRYIVRRLTPLECCRLQGFPDNWEDGVQGSDSARYKMWGNGIALPCAVDVLRRIAQEVRNETTD